MRETAFVSVLGGLLMVKNKQFALIFSAGLFFVLVVFFWSCTFSSAYALAPMSPVESVLSITTPDSVIANVQAIRENIDFVLFILFPLFLAVFLICKGAHWFYCAFVKGFL